MKRSSRTSPCYSARRKIISNIVRELSCTTIKKINLIVSRMKKYSDVYLNNAHVENYTNFHKNVSLNFLCTYGPEVLHLIDRYKDAVERIVIYTIDSDSQYSSKNTFLYTPSPDVSLFYNLNHKKYHSRSNLGMKIDQNKNGTACTITFLSPLTEYLYGSHCEIYFRDGVKVLAPLFLKGYQDLTIHGVDSNAIKELSHLLTTTRRIPYLSTAEPDRIITLDHDVIGRSIHHLLTGVDPFAEFSKSINKGNLHNYLFHIGSSVASKAIAENSNLNTINQVCNILNQTTSILYKNLYNEGCPFLTVDKEKIKLELLVHKSDHPISEIKYIKGSKSDTINIDPSVNFDEMDVYTAAMFRFMGSFMKKFVDINTYDSIRQSIIDCADEYHKAITAIKDPYNDMLQNVRYNGNMDDFVTELSYYLDMYGITQKMHYIEVLDSDDMI